MKNLILGAAKGYGWDVLEPFVTSRKKNCRDAQLVLFVNDISAFTCDKLLHAGVTLENFPDEFGNIVANNTRWKIFADYLARAECDNVFITDTRDVIFQGDIFAPFANLTDWLGVATEGDNFRGDRTGDTTNHAWLADCYGTAAADALLDKKIICDGTVIGSRREVKIFAETLWAHVAEVQSRVDFRIHDQAVANYIIYNGRVPVKNFVELDIDSAILTMGLAGNFFVRGDKILRGEVPAVVHQYERFDHTAQLADKIYRDKKFRADPNFNDIRSVIEQATCLLHANKIDAAAQLFIGKFLATKNFSDVVNALMRLWSVAVTKNFSKPLTDIEAAVQIALKSVGNFPAVTLQDICKLIGRSHSVDAQFRTALINSLTAAKNSLPDTQRERREFCDELLKHLR